MKIRDLLAKHDIEIISERDGGEVMMICPFHADANASFSMNLENGKWNCFGCDARGKSISSFVRRLEGTDRQDIKIELEAKLRGREQVVEPPTELELGMYPRLENGTFLARRGLGKGDVNRWEMKDAGHGVLLPIRSKEGILTGTVLRRYVIEDMETKYKYSAGFKRKLNLFGANHFKGKKAILVEGIFDVVNLYRLGYENVLGILGSSMGASQRELIRELGITKILLMLDNDDAGKDAAWTIAEQCTGVLDVYLPKFSSYGDLKDPGEIESCEQVDRIITGSQRFLKVKLQIRGRKF